MAARAGVKRIVVGVDGSESSQAALTWAIRMAQGMGSKVTAVHALGVPSFFPAPFGVPVQYDEGWREDMKREFEKWCEPLKASGVGYQTVMETGRPASVIAEVAERDDADVIVVARRGRGEVAELLLGSVSHELALHSKRPVLLIEPGPARKP